MVKANLKRKYVLGVIVIAILIFLCFVPKIVEASYYVHLLNITFIWIVMTSGLNIIQGYAGYVSLCQMSLYGLGAYVAGFMTNSLGLPLIANILVAIVFGFIIGTLVGWPTLKTKGHYFSIATLSFSMLLFVVLDNWYEVTGGAHGFTVTKLTGQLFGFDITTERGYFYISLFFAVLAVIFVMRLVRSRTGRAIITLRENEALAEAIGVNTNRIKKLAFNLSAILGCIGGVLYAHYLNYINPAGFCFRAKPKCNIGRYDWRKRHRFGAGVRIGSGHFFT